MGSASPASQLQLPLKRILFVCLGNICRSPMAQSVMAYKLAQIGRNDVLVSSAATSDEECGNPVHGGTQRELARHHVPLVPHRAVTLERLDADLYDAFIGMETANVRRMKQILGPEAEHKCFRLLDLTDHPRDIADPWFTGNFEKTWDDIQEGCDALLNYV